MKYKQNGLISNVISDTLEIPSNAVHITKHFENATLVIHWLEPIEE